MNDTRPPDRPITIVQVTDPHLYGDPACRLLGVQTDASLRGVLQHIIAHQLDIDLLLATGDITQDNSVAAHKRFLRLAAGVPAPLRGLPGNHDAGPSFHQIWRGHADPIMDIGNWRLILLDTRVPGSNAGRLGDDQLELLFSAAKQAKHKHLLIAMHHNPVPMGSAWLDAMMLANPDALFDTLRQLPQARAILWGHVHQEYDGTYDLNAAPDPQKPEDATYTPHRLRLFSTPSTCVQFTPGGQTFSLDSVAPAYRWLVLQPDGSLDTGVTRVEGLGLKPSMDSSGY
ncbi:metallophosphoesterase [Alcaligenaceae bacterium CGII-47]|nr:metallophosphoesterase [Alcaligenaceae bacterium CGII-47]